ncbi:MULTISPECIES: 23S rRNA pseudouridine(1911/1915/1917) synthase RluD [unclassified Oceanobacter]|jgi:23S rRNA pseudouridine1911/1915/1917 synthase|uniref:23S rRNA pseudouridine(1911/1915/1917) synthase RluD n=1 Tax=unclassified Oceanobacter TaxID=2620260 RepID=UPI0026E1C07D|nr:MULTISPECIES: 23S rRNA pseudouridine(1911/1915/1917) synthase RluD [unclassified Oceanobacter]MDO6681266.1 23S rRNA pseudouridine(1911/1915/1917) synthase RluD [Oceanobacter sp. 5_MG-2023]MDP2505215.1 23S rRNA pseudouridine(1911/1915/1917) synthase RluD [Oceanobacter sp. 3_MG-2023]MDP2549200.1 23S rRNA pseudouridine(1911/1915/1917) synthase RluD [Oceanobacter sp. 4_MG-2023]MDP2608011.1 23S rRNA pseudouridine(1911/1915/1917) synthase RluD [Oceanobacter sp. 1_MG-2023]MDP2611327.1 23S rRNA pse
MTNQISISTQVPFDQGNKRLDQVAAQLFPDYSRSRLQQWIKDGQLTVDGKLWRGRDKLTGGETLALEAELSPEGDWLPEAMDLDIVYEDDHILVLNKQADLVVHPAAGNREGTLLNGLLHHCPELANIPRAGIVHRLDKDTTGLMVVAKTLQAQAHLVAQLQDRTMGREYEAVVQGYMTGGGKVDEPIGRHGTQRTRMAVNPVGKDAVTHYRVLHKFPTHTHIRCKLETGRTHQIRVHMTHIGHPLVGDATYAARTRLTKGIGSSLRSLLQSFPRQALHAKALGLLHPVEQEWMEWEVDLPDDIIELLEMLEEDRRDAHNR